MVRICGRVRVVKLESVRGIPAEERYLKKRRVGAQGVVVNHIESAGKSYWMVIRED